MLAKHPLYYHTFGAPMATRNKQVSSVLVAKTVSQSSFSSGLDGWVATTNATLSNVYGNIRATVTALNAGMQKTFSTEAGKTYRIRFKVNLRGWPYMYVKDVASTTNLISITDFMTPGDYSYIFTATGFETNIIFHEAGNASGSVQLASFTLEEVDAENGYRFGFNGQEKDDEVSGAGNSMTAEFWEYDARLARRWNVDPKTSQYPNISPYSVFNNNPIFYIDPKGLEGESAEKRKMAKYDRKAKKLSQKTGKTGEELGDAMEEKYGKKRWMYQEIENKDKTNAQRSFVSIRDLVDFRDAPRVAGVGFQFTTLNQGPNDLSLSSDGRPLVSFNLSGSGAFQINPNISGGTIGITISQGATAFQETALLANIVVTNTNVVNIPFNPSAGAFITLRLNMDNAGANSFGNINYAMAGSIVPINIPTNVSYPQHIGISKSVWSNKYSLLDEQRRQLRAARDINRAAAGGGGN